MPLNAPVAEGIHTPTIIKILTTQLIKLLQQFSREKLQIREQTLDKVVNSLIVIRKLSGTA